MPSRKQSKKSSKTKRKNQKKWMLLLIAFLSILGLSGLVLLFLPNVSVNSPENNYFYISTGAKYEDVLYQLDQKQLLSSKISFQLVATMVNYQHHVKPGKYLIEDNMSNFQLIKMLRLGQQEQVKLVINKLRTEEDFIQLIAKQLEPDADSIRNALHDIDFMKSIDVPFGCGICTVIPDTYIFSWNSSAHNILNRLAHYYHAFWNEQRQNQAKSLGFSENEIMVLASIVEEESNYLPEKGNIASVYINRLKSGMKLQADPTAKYAFGDFTIKRVTSAITALPSPYNTYYAVGLPPTPICTPSKNTIDAVLNAPKTNYYYFCAKEDFSGQHRFAANYVEHMKNAALYQQALNKRNIH